MTQDKPKTILITGAAKRIGRAIALGLAEKGWDIALHYHHAQKDADDIITALKEQGRRAIAIKADLADSDAVAQIIAHAYNQLGPINALINNAALFEYDDIDALTTQSWDLHMNINLRAPAILARDFVKQALPGSSIINIIDQRVWRLNPHFTSYTISKSGLWTLTQTLAQALAPRTIRVNAIGPGPILPNPRQSEDEFAKQAELTPLSGGATAQDILQAICFLLEAKTLTGQMLAIDGGQHLAWQTPDVVEVKE